MEHYYTYLRPLQNHPAGTTKLVTRRRRRKSRDSPLSHQPGSKAAEPIISNNLKFKFMKPKALRLIFFLLILTAGYNSAYSQLIGTGGSNAGDCITWCQCCECENCAPISILPVMCAVPGTTISVPITVGQGQSCNNFNDIGAVSLRINYDPNVLVFNTVTVPNAPTGWTLLAGTNPAGTLTISYYWDNIHHWDLPNGAHMFDISFNFLGGSTNLTFNEENEACQFATYYNLTSNNGLILCQTAANYVDGFVAGPIVELDDFDGICQNGEPFTLSGGSPEGGTYKVDGVVKTTFNPADYTVGTHTIQYCYTHTYHYGVNNSGTKICTNCDEETIEVYPVPEVGTGTYGPVCADADDIQLNGGTPAGGTWSGDHVFPIAGAPGYFFDVSDAGVGSHMITYTYVNQYGCSNSANTTIVVNPLPILVITDPDPVCSPNTVDLTAAAITAGSTLYGGALTYWEDEDCTDPLEDPDAVGESGTYYIMATSQAGCIDIDEVVVVINPLPPCQIIGAPVVCLGTSTTYSGPDQMTLVVIENNPSYLWDIPEATNFVGAYIDGPVNGKTVTVVVPSDGGGGGSSVQGNTPPPPLGYVLTLTTKFLTNCQSFCSQQIICNVLPEATAEGTDATCFGYANGSVTFTPGAVGLLPFIYTIDGGTPSAPQMGQYTVPGFAMGNYSFTVQDANGCVNQGDFAIGQPDLLTAYAEEFDPILCFGGSTDIELEAAGGTEPYYFTFNGVTNTTGEFEDIPAGTYSWSVTDAHQCGPVTGTVTIGQPPLLTGGESHTPITCFGYKSTVTLTAGGGTPAYSYTFNGVTNTTGIFNNIAAGIYAWSVTDFNQCGPVTGVVTIIEPPLLTGGESHTPITCFGYKSTVTLTAGGGTTPYSYTFNGVTNGTGIFNNIAAGTYNWSVTDVNQCGPVTGTVTIDQPTLLTGGESHTPITCYGYKSTVTLTAGGGTPAYSYTFNGVTNGTGIFNNIGAGTYNWSVTDANQCGPVTGTVTITQPPILTGGESHTAIGCFGGTSAVTLTAGGGTPAYSYTFNGVTQTTGVFTGIVAGTYNWSITDSHQCGPVTGTTTITQPPLLVASASNDSPLCVGQTLHVYGSATGGTPGYTYHWVKPNGNTSNSQNIQVNNVTANSAGVWTLTVTDSHGCTATATTTVVINPLPPSDFTGDFSVCAFSTQNVYTGPAGQAAYHWVVSECGEIVGPDNQQTVTIKVFGPTAKCGGENCTLCLTTTSQFGCTSQTCHDITINPLPSCTISGDNTVGCGSTQQYQGPAGLSYAWSITGDGTITSATNIRTITVLAGAAGNSYTVTLTTTNSNGCSNTCTKYVTIHSHSICGHVEYNNCYETTLVGVTVKLLGNNQLLATTTTDGQGNYSFPNLCDGIYEIVAESPNKPVGGINSTDAAQVNYWGPYPYNIEMVKFMCGDVTNNNFMAAIDAQRIQRFFVFGDAFDRPTWVYWQEGVIIHSNTNPLTKPSAITATINDDNETVNLLGMVTGDYNGSFNPGSKKSASATLQLVYDGNLQVTPGQEFDLPISVLSQTEVGAVSLLLDIPTDLVEVKDVVMKGTGTPLNFTVNGNELRIGWNSTTPVNVAGGGDLIILKLKATERFVDGTSMKLTLAADELNELANGAFSVIPDATLMVDVVANGVIGIDEQNGENLSFLAFPNPFLDFTTITYTLPESGKVNVQIHDMLGNSVQTVVDETMVAGKYTKKVDFRGMPQGVYTATILFDNGKEKATRTIKLIVYK
jgi:hypothetical protein